MKISEVSKKYNIPIDTLRYYEKIGLLPAVGKNSSGIRNYKEDDCKWIEFVLCMKSAGLSIEVLRNYIQLFIKGDDTISQRYEILKEERKKLLQKKEEIEKTIDKLNYKIDVYYKNLISQS